MRVHIPFLAGDWQRMSRKMNLVTLHGTILPSDPRAASALFSDFCKYASLPHMFASLLCAQCLYAKVMRLVTFHGSESL